MRRHRALWIALTLTGCAGMRDTVQLASDEPLRLSRIVLYENGLAHFERRGPMVHTDNGDSRSWHIGHRKRSAPGSESLRAT